MRARFTILLIVLAIVALVLFGNFQASDESAGREQSGQDVEIIELPDGGIQITPPVDSDEQAVRHWENVETVVNELIDAAEQ